MVTGADPPVPVVFDPELNNVRWHPLAVQLEFLPGQAWAGLLSSTRKPNTKSVMVTTPNSVV